LIIVIIIVVVVIIILIIVCISVNIEIGGLVQVEIEVFIHLHLIIVVIKSIHSFNWVIQVHAQVKLIVIYGMVLLCQVHHFHLDVTKILESLSHCLVVFDLDIS